MAADCTMATDGTARVAIAALRLTVPDPSPERTAALPSPSTPTPTRTRSSASGGAPGAAAAGHLRTHRLVGMISEADLARHLPEEQVGRSVEVVCAAS
ncbi:hypothetical protein [Actinacidiphila soli]|uniref:hypothetical protein n=1 Tax=Actinacidiphila soli TaxID=2487275 RepID=UPI000FCB3A00|nr:hypothetical protein [Actinacidiphila soli]